jgi:hypothetical protein
MERLGSVLSPKGTCIVAAPALQMGEELPLAAMVGTRDSDHRSWWIFNRNCLVELFKCAGFGRADIVGDFVLERRKTKFAPELKVPHIVAHAQL